MNFFTNSHIPLGLIKSSREIGGSRIFLWSAVGLFLPTTYLSNRRLHASPVRYQNPNHRLWKTVDWDKVAGGLYAIVDPADPAAVLYLSERDYKIQVRVSLSTDSPLVVLARAGEVRLLQVERASGPGPKDEHLHASKDSSSSEEKGSSDSDSPNKNTPPKGDRPKDRLEYGPRMKRSKEETLRQRTWNKLLNWSKSLFSRYVSSGAEDVSIVLSHINITDIVCGWSYLTYHWAGKTLAPTPTIVESTRSIALHLKDTLHSQGSNGVIRLLKNSSVIIRRFLAGNPVKDAWEIGHPIKVTRVGLPQWLPVQVRRSIMNYDVLVLRWIFSLLNMYKAFHCSYKPIDLQNITDAHPDIDSASLADFARFCKEEFWGVLVKNLAKEAGKPHLVRPDLSKMNYFDEEPALIRTGSPNGRVSILAAALDTIAWGLAPVNWLKEFLRNTGDLRTSRLFDLVSSEAQKVFPEIAYLSHKPFVNGSRQPMQHRELGLGKLALKLEPAGKKRVFAIVDYWSQRALKPLHDWMMEILRLLPSDATFDQNGSVSFFAFKKRDSAHSYDLKAATDLIPQDLYEVLLKCALPEPLVDSWLMLLTDRWFLVPPEECSDVSHVKYTRGQPMGALSSWPSMALVHHAVILWSARRAGISLTSTEIWDYRVLGDDAVIGQAAVGESYVTSTQLLHIRIGLKVSLISDLPTRVGNVIVDHVNKALVVWDAQHPNVLKYFKEYKDVVRRRALGPFFEFANQYWLGNVNLSPMSLKQELRVRTPAQRIDYALRVIARWGISPGESWVARLCRTLLTPSAYVEANKWWRKGQLGPTLQVALITAFGPASGVIRRVGFQWSSFVPLLLALANSCTLLGADQRILSGSKDHIPGGDELSVNLTIAYAKNLLARVLRDRDCAQAAVDAADEFVTQGMMGAQMLSAQQTGKRLPTCLGLVMADHITHRSGGLIYDPEMAQDDALSGAGGQTLVDRQADQLVDLQLFIEALVKRYSSVPPVSRESSTATPKVVEPVVLPVVAETTTLLEAPPINLEMCPEEFPLLLEGKYEQFAPPGWLPTKEFVAWVNQVLPSIASGQCSLDIQSEDVEDCLVVKRVIAKFLVKETTVVLPQPVTTLKDEESSANLKILTDQAFSDLEDLFDRFSKAPIPLDLTRSDLLFEGLDAEAKMTDQMRKWRMNMDMIAPAVRHSGVPVWLETPLIDPEGLNAQLWWSSLQTCAFSGPKKA